MMPDEPDPVPPMPAYGKLRGKRVSLAEAPSRLSADDLAQVEVEIPGQGVIRPWRFSSAESDCKFEVSADGKTLTL